MQDVFMQEYFQRNQRGSGDSLRNTISTFPFYLFYSYQVELLVQVSPNVEVLPAS